ncbi:hypothetical protein K435DRAFT_868813 [Dendrothele bispora CBS 962.96]|uniref:Uncharacterized protein n=1 Tax=Dendrothele bispora (strain CBS 962.96) TaxID=1314807 RepID=A0A4S8LAS3_DENBC|nr:hypothetical protein K435DRAFT_868813 [Dendrothele bispora CBS 962.96]
MSFKLGDQIERPGTNVSDGGIWDWVSTGEDPFSAWNDGTMYMELSQPPQGNVEGKKWLYTQLSRLTDGWVTLTDNAHHDAL